MSLIELSNTLQQIEIEEYEDSEVIDTYGFNEIFNYIAFDYESFAKDDESIEEYVNRVSDDIFEGYKIGDKGNISNCTGDFVVEFEIIDNKSLFEEWHPQDLFKIELKVSVPLGLIEKCENEMGYSPF
ncbi:hypothetical protein YY92_08210 [Campylobacter fetus]|uniref:hypothetical protein n=1 Tax=Campylobacter fetus TaxID=196 RepID=UPI0011CCC679|nr:hypothetical protein [Campylobacter fetus]EAJ1232628.1 hypothetical protein [Campylobacter fetus]EAK0414693.1 hypothetical protein [Campylobacter fetus]TXF09191.1 hypothetical protein FPD25_03395 [Campylobacter fetus subsp. fetus]